MMKCPQDRDDAAGRTGAGPLRLSIVTPNFNGAAFIEETLKSVVAQNYPNLDFVVVDGASTDCSLDLINGRRSEITTLVSEPDRGHADAINKGFAASTGEIMGWINSDDTLLPGALDFVNRVFRARPDIEWITGRPTSMDEAGKIGWMGPLRPWSRLRFLSGDHKWIQQESTFWRRSLWERAGGKLDLRYSLANDFDLWRRFFRHAELFTVDRPLGCFRLRGGQRSIAFKSLYEAEMSSILKEEFIVLEPEFRAAFDGLLPTSDKQMKSASAIAADRRYSIGDPPIIRSSQALGWAAVAPRRAAAMPIGQAFAADDLRRFKGLHEGERCFIMGNGPSLNRMDLSRLEGEIVFACNGAFLLFDRVSWRPRYYVCVDSRVLPDRAAEIDKMLQENPGVQGFFPAALQEHTDEKPRRATRMILPPGHNRNFFTERPNSTENLPHSMFSHDIDDYVVQPYTVAISMLQIAAYMGFKEIYLIGCDTDYAVIDTVKREGTKGEDRVGLISSKDDDPNHFDRRYFGRNRKWHDPRPEMMIRHYGYAKEALDAIGVNVCNATVGGKLEVFPRRRFEEVTDAPSQAAAPTPAPSAPKAGGGAPVKGMIKSLVRAAESAASMVWRARAPLLVVAAATLLFLLIAAAPQFADYRAVMLAASGFVFLLGLIYVATMRLRGFIVELSRQVLDIAGGAVKPDEGALLGRLEMEDEITRLRDEIKALKSEISKLRSGAESGQ